MIEKLLAKVNASKDQPHPPRYVEMTSSKTPAKPRSLSRKASVVSNKTRMRNDPDINSLLERIDIIEKDKSNLDSELQLHQMEKAELETQNKAL